MSWRYRLAPKLISGVEALGFRSKISTCPVGCILEDRTYSHRFLLAINAIRMRR